MKLYSDFPARRLRQGIADAAALSAIVIAIALGAAVHGLVAPFSDVGAQLEAAGSGFEETMVQVGENLGGVPLIGDGIRVPFDAASGAGAVLADAGQAQQDVAGRIALTLGLLVAAGPILAVLAVWLPLRLRFARRAAETRVLALSADGPELLALRALVTRPGRELAAVTPEPLRAWRSGDPDAVRGLASLELRRAGVRLH